MLSQMLTLSSVGKGEMSSPVFESGGENSRLVGEDINVLLLLSVLVVMVALVVTNLTAGLDRG